MLKIAMISKWHVHAETYGQKINESGKAIVSDVWHPNKEEGKKWADSLNANYYDNLDEMLAKTEATAVVCDAETTKHCNVLIKAARAGKNIFTEKALAPTVKECELIKKEIIANNCLFCISYPYKSSPVIKFAKEQILNGAFGDVTFVRVRNAHDGVSGKWLPNYWFEEKDAAGGAMMDLGCHPVYILADFLGKPKRVKGLFNSPFGTKVDENAVMSVEFENGAIGVAETAFVSYECPFLLEVHGTKGRLISTEEGYFDFKSELVSNNDLQLPAPDDEPIIQFIDACINNTGSPKGMGIDDAIALTELLEKAYISNKE